MLHRLDDLRQHRHPGPVAGPHAHGPQAAWLTRLHPGQALWWAGQDRSFLVQHVRTATEELFTNTDSKPEDETAEDQDGPGPAADGEPVDLAKGTAGDDVPHELDTVPSTATATAAEAEDGVYVP